MPSLGMSRARRLGTRHHASARPHDAVSESGSLKRCDVVSSKVIELGVLLAATMAG